MPHFTLEPLLARLPGPRTARHPEGEQFTVAHRHGSMVLELYAPRGRDPQTPHTRDELYFVIRGSGEFVHNDRRTTFGPGDAFFVPAGDVHRFENFSADFATWVVFYGPEGGEAANS